MGYDVNRFEGDVDEELICPICSFILEDPVQAPECEHAFCHMCINQWLNHQSICPIDRAPILAQDLKPVPRILKNLLSKLKLKCDYADYGCNLILRLENLNTHLQECDFNPKKPIICALGCNILIAKDEFKSHNCIKELRKIVDDQQSKINHLSNEVSRQKIDLDTYIGDLRILKSFANKYFRVSDLQSGPQTSSLNVNLTDEDDIARWSASLVPAKVGRWGGIISTPDTVLQAVIKRALIESGCPSNILNELMQNAHERNWPSGLCTLETRQINRNDYINFVCKRVLNKQAVLILACDNKHMPNHLIIEPGVILIFAHGVE
jgi:E3 ubiquitin-protein ligase NRDP1